MKCVRIFHAVRDTPPIAVSIIFFLLFKEIKIHEKECDFNKKIHHKFSSKVMITFKKYNSKLCYMIGINLKVDESN